MEIVSAYQSQKATGLTTSSASSTSSNAAGSQISVKSSSKSDSSTDQADAGHRLQAALAKLDIPELADSNARIELNFNQETGRVIAKVTDRSNGEVLREIPSKELQHLFSQIREYLGSIVDEEV
ncbi:flagellar protein FlaG [Thalassospira xiamenensis]|uniref:Flagellar protein FlaG n=1 Tax=Thalassospira xiamenensis TaxID=220697 RepID=A0A285RMP6_9PROT|nr:flagellar protein FlaG [Thalassospira xiamenensis]SOB95395.1 flagellar protein FlaG [Thalassospira xiamenensis]